MRSCTSTTSHDDQQQSRKNDQNRCRFCQSFTAPFCRFRSLNEDSTKLIPLLYPYPPIALAVSENTLLACEPTKRMGPTTMTRMTANITAYSAMSCPSLSDQQLCRSSSICPFLEL